VETFRNNGIKFNRTQLTDEEVLNMVGYTAERASRHQRELDEIVGEAVTRGLVEVDMFTPVETVEPQDAA
jgi:hypothetical protein